MAYTPSSFPGYDAAFDSKSTPSTFGISSAVTLPAGIRIITTSGHVGSINGEGVITGDLKEQISESFKNVERALLSAATYESSEQAWKSVYEITSYHIGGVSAAYEHNLENATRYFGAHSRPAWTAVGVADLAYEGQLVEIQVKAVAP